jgi:hypothetical protein
VLDEEQSPPGNCLNGRSFQLFAGMGRKPGTFILDLPNQPVCGHNAADPQAFRGIAAVAMANGIYEGLMETQV